ncbi:MAG: DUF4846 domain-containing protein [Acidobacteriota bacterium]
MLRQLALVVLIAAMSTDFVRADHPWEPSSKESLAERFPAPLGATRIEAKPGSFATWLRTLPVKPKGSPVLHFDGSVKPLQVHAAVLDIDVGDRDLQQCADAVIRLRAEYLREARCESDIAFQFTSGDVASWSEWAMGRRPTVNGSAVTWTHRAQADASYGNFRRYLDTVFAYAGTLSLEQELEPVDDPSAVEPGDVFIQGGSPGHAVIVLDVVEDARGARRFLLGQSYMPAQEIHVLKRPGHSDPWYPATASGAVETPEWRFHASDLHRFPPVECDPPTAAKERPLSVGGDVTRPQRLEGELPDDFSESGCDLPEKPFVILIIQAVIDTEGRIESAELLKGPSGECFASYILAHLKTWRFEPATLHGRPVRVYYNLSVHRHYR